MNPAVIQELRNTMYVLLRDNPELHTDTTLRESMFEAETDLHEVIRQLLFEITAAKGLAEGLVASILELKLRQSRLEHRSERLRATALSLMQTAGLSKLTLPEGTVTVTLRPPEPMRPDGLDGIPEDFLKTTVELDWKALKSAAKEGRTFDGLKWSNGTAQLTIRT